MDKKVLFKSAAAVAASIAMSPAIAEAAGYDFKQCVPVNHASEISIYEVCDATELNKKLNLKLGSNGCAVQQHSESEIDYVYYFAQADYTQWVNDGEQPKKLPDCKLEDIAAFEQEL